MDGLRSSIARGGLLLVLTAPALAAEKDKQVRVDRYGDPLPEGAVLRLGTIRFRQGDEIKCLAFSPDGKLLASGDRGGIVRLWDRSTGKEIRRMCLEFDPIITSLTFAPDGKSLVSACLNEDGIQFWDVNTGKKLSRSIQHEKAGAVRFSPDGKTLATIGQHDKTVRLWDTASGRCLHKIPGSILYGHTLAFSSDGKLLAVRDVLEKDVCLWEVATGKLLHRLRGHTDDVQAICFTADGRILASGAEDGTIRLWEPSSGKEVSRLKVSQFCISVLAFLTDGRTLAFSDRDDESIRLWDTANGQQVRVLAKHKDSLDCLCLSPDGRTLAGAGDGGTVRLWDAATGKEHLLRDAHQQQVNSGAWSPDGRVIATASNDRTVRLWDAETGKPQRCFDGNEMGVGGVAFAADGRMLASIGHRHSIRVWETAAASKLRELTKKEPGFCGDPIFGPDHKLFALPSFESMVHVWDLDTQREIRQMKTSARLETMALSPDGKILATGNTDHRIHLWDAATGKEIYQLAGHAETVEAVAFSPDGRTLASASEASLIDATVRLWEVATWGERACLKVESDSIRGLAFLHEGRTLAGTGYRTIYLWDLPSGQVRRKLEGHEGWIRRIVASPDGRKLLSASEDTTALVWDVPFPHQDRSDMHSEPRPNELPTLWSDLANSDAVRAYRAMQVLISSPKAAISFFRTRLRPVSAAPAERLARLIADLDSESFAQREKAERALEGLGELAVPALERTLKQRPLLETRRRIEGILGQVRRQLSSEQLSGIRAVEVLEHLVTSEAQEILQTLARGTAEARLTQEAKASLKRLSLRKP